MITVADTGIGMAPHEIAMAMERFGQVESGLARRLIFLSGDGVAAARTREHQARAARGAEAAEEAAAARA